MKFFRFLFLFAPRLRSRHALAMLLLAAGSFFGPSAHAAGCFLPGSAAVDFGAISPDRPTDSRGSITLTCQGDAAPSYVRYCVYLPDGAPLPGIDPRLMTNYNGAQMRYDLYSDSTLKKIIGPPPAGGGFPVYTGTLDVPGGYAQATVNIPLYGSVPAGQSLPATQAFESQIANSVVTWSLRTGSYPLACDGGPLTQSNTTYLHVKATVGSGCRITLATDLDFGSAASLAVKHDQTSTLLVRCPLSTRWTMGLDNGINASSGTRRMSNGSGQYVAYELYQDMLHRQRWGNTGIELASGTGAGESSPSSSTVYGRIPPQVTAPPGVYSDTVIVTLTY